MMQVMLTHKNHKHAGSGFGLQEEESQTAQSMSFKWAFHIAISVPYGMYNFYPIKNPNELSAIYIPDVRTAQLRWLL